MRLNKYRNHFLGCNTGIGKITAHEISKKGARVIMLCRNTEKAEEAATEIRKDTGNQVDVHKLDLSSLKSVRECAQILLDKEDKIDILINNAGNYSKIIFNHLKAKEFIENMNILVLYLYCNS